MKNIRRLSVAFFSLLAFAPTETLAWSRKNRQAKHQRQIAEFPSVEDQCFIPYDFHRATYVDYERQRREKFMAGFGNMILYSIAIGASIMGLVTALTLFMQQRQSRFRSGEQDDDQNVGTNIDFNLNGSAKDIFNDEDLDIAFDGIKLSLKQKVEVEKKTIENGKEVITKKKKVRSRYLLDGSLRGCASAGRMLAVMGPSGAGKSVFLHALAGRIKANSKLTLSGDRFVNGVLQKPNAALPVAFVEQEVNFFPRMTVRETLSFRVALHYGDLMNEESRDALVHNLLDQLGLMVAADTIVGDAKVRGISSGERKRLSIAVEMISSPGLIFCDEPTSSLDSAAAAVVIEKLRQMADQGKTVVCVIHQPSSAIFALFDDLLLISEGRQMYHGPVSEVKQYMEDHGFHAHRDAGTAEHILECVSPHLRMGETPQTAEKRLRMLAALAVEESQEMDIGIDHTDFGKEAAFDEEPYENEQPSGPRTSMWTQFQLLLHRSLAETFRGKDIIMIKTAQQVTVACIYGGIYSLGSNQASIMDRFGLLSLTSIGGTNMAIATTLRSFPKEKTIASAEIAIKQYRALPYFAAKAISEFPLVFFYNAVMAVILYFSTGMNPGTFWRFLGLITLHALSSEASGMAVGAVSPTSDVALAIFPAILILFVIFDGRNISQENTPYFLRWISKISLIRWGFEGLAVNEFHGLVFDAEESNGTGTMALTGEEALRLYGLEDASVDEVVKTEAIIMAVCWVLAYFGLTLTKQRFLAMEAKK